MKNPALHLVGIAASPAGGEVFGSRAEEELRLWLEARLDALGIDPLAYSRFVLSLLRCPDSALTPPVETTKFYKTEGRRYRSRPKLSVPAAIRGDQEQKRTVVQCLTSAADNKCGVEALVDELCIKLRDLEGGGSNDKKEDNSNSESKVNVESLTPQDKALRYYAAFPALQPYATVRKLSQKKDRNCTNIVNNNNDINNRNNGINYNNRKNNKISNKKSKMSISIKSQRSEEKSGFGFAKSMEREREKEKELELDRLKLEQLQAKFDESLEALWDSGPSNVQDRASIWAAPTLAIPAGPIWMTDKTNVIVNPSTSETPYQESIVDDSPLIPWDIDLIGIEEYADECEKKNESDRNIDWSDAIIDGPWSWKGLDSNLTSNLKDKSETNDFPVESRKTPIGTCNELRRSINSKVSTNLSEPDEDLLTSAKTHFRPIKDDGHWADGTTFPINNAFERVAYRRSESGNLLYLPGGESPYMEFRENESSSSSIVSTSVTGSNLTLKFRVRQCDKCVQTEPNWSPSKRRIISEQDRFYYSPIKAQVEVTIIQESKEIFQDRVVDETSWTKPIVPPHNDRKRRHSSSLDFHPLTVLRPLTL